VSRAHALAFALGLVVAPAALAQDDARGRLVNPLAPRSREAPKQDDGTPLWAGTFANDTIEVSLRPAVPGAGRDFEGTITIDGVPHRARGGVKIDRDMTRLEGGFLSDGAEFPFTAALRSRDQLILASAGTTYSLDRVHGERVAQAREGQPGQQARPAAQPDAQPQQTRQPERSQRAGIDVSGIHAGQIYVFRTQPGQELRWTVREVARDGVSYTAQSYVEQEDGQLAPVGQPMPSEFPLEEGARILAGPDVPHARAVVSGVSFDCVVMTADDVSTWVPLSHEHPTFPGAILTTRAGVPVQELIRIDER
jgi:hypothetical protein